MSLELKNVEKKVGLETHIYPTNLKLEKNTIKYSSPRFGIIRVEGL